MLLTKIHRRNNLATENEKLVHKVVHRMSATCREPYEDLYQIGYLGLLKAAARFDHESGNAFSSFAIPYIQGEIQHFLRDQWQSIKIPRTALELKAKVRRVQRSLSNLGREVSAVDVAAGLGIDAAQWQQIEAMDSNIAVSLDELLFEPMQEENEDIAADVVLRSLSHLQDKQRVLVVEKFFNNLSEKDIAKKQNTSPQAVKATIRIALSKLRISLIEAA
ncbi:sigma-70 family RNA polymerase sigma factor [Anabaena sp. CCY 9910]|uniref:sigma-70 family RNA polymerase sigma factor n=1 Tax=Anabaena sp. CCY 9910 TaxID=3103870 RepID=UPI0039DF8069